MAQGQRLDPAARDAAVRRIAVITTGVVTLGLAGTVGLGVAIAAGIPEKDTVDTTGATAYEEVAGEQEPAPATVPTGSTDAPAPTQQGKPATAPTQQKKPTPAPKPRTTTKAPQTQSGGS